MLRPNSFYGCYCLKNTGNPLGSLLFAIAFQCILNAVKFEFPDVKIVAYHDDLTLQGPRQSLLKAFEFIKREALKQLNLSIQSQKSFLLTFNTRRLDKQARENPSLNK